MDVKLYKDCYLFCLNQETRDFFVIDPNKVNVIIKKGRPEYQLKAKDFRCIIVQASNKKKSLSKDPVYFIKKIIFSRSTNSRFNKKN